MTYRTRKIRQARREIAATLAFWAVIVASVVLVAVIVWTPYF